MEGKCVEIGKGKQRVVEWDSKMTYASCQTSICWETAAAASDAGAGAGAAIAREARRDAEMRVRSCILNVVC